MTPATELLPCPFCGEIPVSNRVIRCATQNCPLEGIGIGYIDWNTRTQPEGEAVAGYDETPDGIAITIRRGDEVIYSDFHPKSHTPRTLADEVDARRYRWLRDKSVHFELPDRGTPYCVYGLGMGDSNPTWGTELDAMVDYCMSPDAAIAAQVGEVGNG